MTLTRVSHSAVKVLSITALLLAGSVFHEEIMAQANVAVTPIAQPVTDTGIALAPARGSAVSVASLPDAWGGQRSGAEATLSDRVVHYQIAATLDPVKHTVEGKQKLTWRNRSKVEVRSVYLHLYMNAFEGGESTFFTEQRNSGKGFRTGVGTKQGEWGHIALRSVTQGGAKVAWSYVHPDNGPQTDHTVVRFDLPAAVAPGASTVMDIDFLTKLPRVIARTGYFGSFHLVGQWFPKIGVLELPGERGATAPRWNVHEHHQESEFYADFGNYDVTLTAPKAYTIGATGVLQAPPVEKNGMLTHHYVQGDVHDFAWTADNRSAKPLQESWTGPGSPKVALSVIYPPEMKASAIAAMKAAKDSLAYFSRTLGPYPYKTLTVVVPPFNAAEAGGMEYPTFMTIEGKTRVEPKTMAAFDIDFVTIHEFGHGYFYGILASNEHEEPMLDEGLNEYWDHRMLVERKQDVYPVTPFLKAIGITFSAKGFDGERAGAPREEPADPIGENAYDRLQGIGPAYVRSATMMRDLEARLGKDATERAFKEYYKRWKFRHPSVADLREALADGSGQRAVVEAVFAQQVYATAKIDDRVDKFSSDEVLPQRGTRDVKGTWVEENADAVDKRVAALRAAWNKANPNVKAGTKAGTRAAAGPFPYRTSVVLRRRGAPVPQTVLVKFADGSSETVTWNNEARWQRYTWLKPSRAVSVELDPQRMHYLDVSKLDDSRTLKADTRASRRWSADLAAIFTLLFSLIANV
ncbi:M1 family metallopeptidase [Massilia sp. TSP1-1-2]|uniref:M1 family metallopeptidase n=1 Tax=Massilia sp. TSP1-1-2 TaxID=2804649 RepID=UPI003CF7DDE2